MTHNTQHQQRTGGDHNAPRDALKSVTLIAAIMTTGLIAGVFAAWSNAIMPGLNDVDDRAFVTAFRALDDAINNPLFLGGFTVALPLIGLAAVLHRGADQRVVQRWVGAALVLYLMAVVITFGVHEPLNEKFRTAAEPTSGAEFAAARAQLDEAKWTAWNTARALTSTIAFGCLAWALVLRGRLGRVSGRSA